MPGVPPDCRARGRSWLPTACRRAQLGAGPASARSQEGKILHHGYFSPTLPGRSPSISPVRKLFAPVGISLLEIGISLFQIGISLQTNRDFPLPIARKSGNFATSDEDKGQR